MITYSYECQTCTHRHEAERHCQDRQTVPCPHCGAPPEEQVILLNPRSLPTRFTEQPRLTTEAEVIAERGPDWRSNAASRRMRRGEPERLYVDGGGMGTTAKPRARRGVAGTRGG